MKKKIFWIIYSLILIGIGVLYSNNDFSSVTVFLYPFTFIGNGIRILLLENIFSLFLGILIFMFLTALPIMYLLYRFNKKKVLSWEIILLSLQSIITIFALYLFINPATNMKLARLYQNTGYSTIQFLAASIYYSLFFLYTGLRIMYYKENNSTKIITKILLYGLTVIITSNIIINSITSIIFSVNFLNIQILQVVEIVLKYIFQSILNVAAIYLLIRLQRNFVRLEGGTNNSLSEVKKIHKFASTFIAVAIGIIIFFIVTYILFDPKYIRLPSLPILELSIFVITWIISKYIIKNNITNINGIDQ